MSGIPDFYAGEFIQESLTSVKAIRARKLAEEGNLDAKHKFSGIATIELPSQQVL